MVGESTRAGGEGDKKKSKQRKTKARQGRRWTWCASYLSLSVLADRIGVFSIYANRSHRRRIITTLCQVWPPTLFPHPLPSSHHPCPLSAGLVDSSLPYLSTRQKSVFLIPSYAFALPPPPPTFLSPNIIDVVEQHSKVGGGVITPLHWARRGSLCGDRRIHQQEDGFVVFSAPWFISPIHSSGRQTSI